MDSMRSLNTSLPKTSKPKPDLLQTFRTAALQVTNVYRDALVNIRIAKAEGYQQALEDLLDLLDRENLGVGDGEGWRIRQWATERINPNIQVQAPSDSEEDTVEEKRARSSSPVMDRNQSPEIVRSSVPPHVESTQRPDSAPSVHTNSPTVETEMATTQPPAFTFSSPQSYPVNGTHDIQLPDMSSAARRGLPHPRRTSTRSSRNLQRSAASNLGSLGAGAGQKRKLLSEFFNVDGAFSDRRDGGGGGGPKRGRMA